MSRVNLRDAMPSDSAWLVDRHATLYANDEGFDESFGPLVSEIIDDFFSGCNRDRERGFIAERCGERLGSIFCTQSDVPGVAKLRLFLLVPEARGQGLGQCLLSRFLEFAKRAGYGRVTLWTHESHRAACRLYAKNGFAMTEAKPVRSFGQNLVEQRWERAL